MNLTDYNFTLPEELIAHEPAEPRDMSRLFIYNTKSDEIIFDNFLNIAKYIPPDSLMVLNDTKVVPARLEVTKITGGKIRVLFLFNEWKRGTSIKGLVDKELAIGDTLFLNHKKILQVDGQNGSEFTFILLVPIDEFLKLCDIYAHTPLPPYLDNHMNEESARVRYQAIFASNPASVAAPTASLHFTERVFKSLDEKGIEREFVTLHVGRGTFAPVTKNQLAQKTLHSEPILLREEASQKILQAKKAGKHVIPVGTTSLRLLEASAEYILRGEGFSGETELFITPPYQFKIVDTFITNFHLPGTSLILLADAFLQFKQSQRNILDLYQIAIEKEFRFYSFGDAMLIL